MLMVSCSNSDKYDINIPGLEESPSVNLFNIFERSEVHLPDSSIHFFHSFNK